MKSKKICANCKEETKGLNLVEYYDPVEKKIDFLIYCNNCYKYYLYEEEQYEHDDEETVQH